jgi:membrane protein DedA with SNARE-associated domain
MDWKTFFANVIGSLAWPILVGVVIYLLRDEMAALLRRMKGAKIAGTELAFGVGEGTGRCRDRRERTP